MVYRAGVVHGHDANARVHIRFSTDEGANWTAENTFTNGNPVTGAPFGGDATHDLDRPIIVKAPNGDLLLIGDEKVSDSTYSGSSQWRSTDGGATWTDEGVITADALGNDAIIVGTTIYAAGNANNEDATLWKSTNNGTTWTKESDVSTLIGDGVAVSECSLCNPSGNILLVVMRHDDSTSTFSRKSTDLGVTWGSLQSIYHAVGVIQRPRLRIFASEPGRIYLIGRNYSGGANNEKTTICYSDDAGETWESQIDLESAYQVDCGYSDALKRANSNIYMTSYRGNFTAATIYEYIVDVLA